MPDFTEYDHKDKVEAYRVTDVNGEDVITSSGSVHCPEGDYVVRVGTDGQVTVMGSDDFQSRYSVPEDEQGEVTSTPPPPVSQTPAPTPEPTPTPDPSPAPTPAKDVPDPTPAPTTPDPTAAPSEPTPPTGDVPTSGTTGIA